VRRFVSFCRLPNLPFDILETKIFSGDDEFDNPNGGSLVVNVISDDNKEINLKINHVNDFEKRFCVNDGRARDGQDRIVKRLEISCVKNPIYIKKVLMSIKSGDTIHELTSVNVFIYFAFAGNNVISLTNAPEISLTNSTEMTVENQISNEDFMMSVSWTLLIVFGCSSFFVLFSVFFALRKRVFTSSRHWC